MNIPKHIAIIMDGNGRWAKARGFSRIAGHNEGAKRIKEIVKAAKEAGVKIITVFAFSTENWDRPKNEISALFSHLNDFLNNYKNELVKENIKLKIIGKRDRLDKNTIKKIEEVENATSKNDAFIFNIAIDYGGRWDIVEAVRRVLTDFQNSKITKEQITEESFGRYLELGSLPDPELLIRTSGEERISNFLLWNFAYTEFYFPDVYWPDFTKEELNKAIELYSTRERRFGKVYG
ncbi:MAG: isoprenyl transferase [Candidatus Omnitrophota bacterium]